MTYKLGPKSLANMDRLHPTMATLAHMAIARSTVDWGFTEPLCRTIAMQRQKVRDGFSQTMNSNHLIKADGFGHAVDCVPWLLVDGDRDGQPNFTWGDPKRFGWPVEVGGVTRFPFFEIAAAWRSAAVELGTAVTWGCAWDRDIRSLPGTWEGMRSAALGYQARRRAIGKQAFLDGPHFELGA